MDDCRTVSSGTVLAGRHEYGPAVSKGMGKKALAVAGLIITDLCSFLLVFFISFESRMYLLPRILPVFPPEGPPHFTVEMWWIPAIIMLCLLYGRLYTRRLPFWRETQQMVTAITLAFMLIFAAVSLAKLGGEVSRTVLLMSLILSWLLFPINRYLIKTLLVKKGLWVEALFILGTGPSARQVAQALIKDKYLGYKVCGFFSDDSREEKNSLPINDALYPIMGHINDAPRVIKSSAVRHVVVALSASSPAALVALVNEVQPYTRSILVVPELSGIPVVEGEADYFFDEQILAFRSRNNLSSPVNIMAKRGFDLLIGGLLLILLIPLLVLIALIIKIDSPGRAIFTQSRIGRNGEIFPCYKFRTMVADAGDMLAEILQNRPDLKAEWEKDFKLKNDPRVTRVGKTLRRLSLDELPQIFNVIKGQMSLVGPRPVVREELERFGPYAREYLMVLPGITGLWQVSGRNDIDYGERVRLESWYVRNWSIWLDISLLFRTIDVVLRRKGAY